MLKLRKYLKPFAVSILVIVALLFAQAMCELTMPDYMSNIVNVGINSNGIEDGILQAVRAQEYEKLALFMSEEEQQIFADNYTLVTPSQASEAQLERYPALADEDVYLLREDAVNTHEEIRQALSQAETYVAGIDQMEVTLQEAMNDPNKAAELSEEQQQLLAVMQQLPQGTSVYDVLGMLSSQQMADLSAQMDEVAQALGESSIDTANAQYVYGEYTAIGMDTEAIQYQYLFVNGAWMLLLALGSAAAAVAVGFLASRIAAGLGRDLRHDMFRKVESFSLAEFEHFSTNTLLTRTTNDIQQIQMVLVMMLRMVIYAQHHRHRRADQGAELRCGHDLDHRSGHRGHPEHHDERIPGGIAEIPHYPEADGSPECRRARVFGWHAGHPCLQQPESGREEV